MNIKLLGGYFYVLGAWAGLYILWRTRAVKNSVAVFLLTFLGIWSFELYMDNYSSRIAVETMPMIGKAIGSAAAVFSIVLAIIAKKTPGKEKQTVMGCLLYIMVSLILMGFGPWQAPQKFYVKYEARHITSEIAELQEEQKRIEELTRYMIQEGMVTPEELGIKNEESTAG
jgi:hypothetical protein